MLFADSPSQILREMLSWEFAGFAFCFVVFWCVVGVVWDAMVTNPRNARIRVAELNAATAAMELERAKEETKGRNVRVEKDKET